MPTEIASAYLALYAKMPGVQGDISKQIGGVDTTKAGEELGKKTSKGFGTAAKVGMTAAAGVAVAGIASVFNTGLDELKFGEQISAQTDQLVKNSGAGFSTKWIEDYTLSLSKMSGVSEEDLQAASNSLLQFGVTDQGIYQQATNSINDIAAKTGDAAGAGKALAKALQDPTKAMGALRKQGVAFTDEQEAMIKKLVESGDTMGAQRVVLGQVEDTYGGVAEAAGGTLQGNMNKLNNTWENLAGTAVTALMPAISGIVGALTGFFNWIQDTEGLLPILAAVIGVVTVAILAATAAMWAMSLTPVALIVMAIVVAVALLIAAIVLLVMNWDTIVKWLTDVWNGFVTWFIGVMDAFLGWWNGLWTAVWTWLVSVWNIIVAAVTAYFTLLWNVMMAVGSAIVGWWNGLWEGIASFFATVWEGILAAIQTVQDTFGTVFGAIADIVRGAFEGVVSVIKGVINNIIGLVNGVIDGINGVAGVIGGAIGVNLSIGHIPQLANGGIVSARPGGTIANIGEGRYDEAVVPLSPGVLSQLGGGGNSGPTVQVDIHPGPGQDEATIGRVAANTMLFELRNA